MRSEEKFCFCNYCYIYFYTYTSRACWIPNNEEMKPISTKHKYEIKWGFIFKSAVFHWVCMTKRGRCCSSYRWFTSHCVQSQTDTHIHTVKYTNITQQHLPHSCVLGSSTSISTFCFSTANESFSAAKSPHNLTTTCSLSLFLSQIQIKWVLFWRDHNQTQYSQSTV